MLEKYKTKLNRIISSVLALTMTASLFNAVPASAETLAGTSKTYLYDGYTVKYDVTNAWDDHSNVNLTITNTSDAPIKNWALKYDTDGDIENIWNGVVFNCDEEFSIIKNAGYNYEIAPDSSITFGYTIVGADELPESIILSSQRKLFNADDYVVTLTVENDWDSSSSSDDSSKPDETTPSEDDIKTDVGQTNDLWVIAYGEYDAAENTIDSDDDGLSDGDELNIYGTVPIDYDTDDDDINDGDEIALGFDPTSTDTNIKTTTI